MVKGCIRTLDSVPFSGGQIYTPQQYVRTAKRGETPRVHREYFENNCILQVKESLFFKCKPKLNGTQSSVLLHLFTK